MVIQNSKHLRHYLAIVILGLTVALQSGSLTASNFDSGVFEFQQKLANNGNPQAQYKLAMMYENGRGVDKDIKAAETWYKKSAANKYKPALYRLTYIEVKSRGFSTKHNKWLHDLSNDAKQGDAEALYLMGELYENGTAVKQDLQQSKKMYKAASTKGNVEAENRLYAVEQKISRTESAQDEKQADNKKAEEAKVKQAAEQKRLAEIERKAQQAKAAQYKASTQRQEQLQAEREQQRLIAERKRIEAERRRHEAAQQKLRKAEVKANAKDNTNKEAAKEAARVAAEKEKFESELCTGRAARFRTQCN